jgi:hypothetical protein
MLRTNAKPKPIWYGLDCAVSRSASRRLQSDKARAKGAVDVTAGLRKETQIGPTAKNDDMNPGYRQNLAVTAHTPFCDGPPGSKIPNFPVPVHNLN